MDMLCSTQSDFQTLRNMWNTKVQEEQKLLKPRPVTYRTQSEIVQKPSIKITVHSSISMNESISSKQQSSVISEEEKSSDDKPIENNFLSVDDCEQFLSFPPPPSSIVFKEQAQSIVTIKQCLEKMFDFDKNKSPFPHAKNTGIHHWHIARHVFRSGLIFVRSRRASDSIIPILIKTHIAHHRHRSDSLDSIFTTTPLESLVDYLACGDNNNDKKKNQHTNLGEKKVLIKRTISDSSACIERNKLNDTIAQYETLMRHLKNYDKFMSTHPVSTPVPPKHSSADIEQFISKTEEELQQHSTTKSSMQSRQTQSLARNAGRTFTDFMMNDLLLAPAPASASTKPLTNDTPRLSIVHAASQTDLTEIVPKTDSTVDVKIEQETQAVIKKLDTVLTTTTEDKKKVSITPNSDINVIVVNSPPVEEKKPQKKEKSLMQRLFEGKKALYSPEDLEMETTRLTDELQNTFELAKKKCFFPSETITYATKMTKIDRRGYKQHIRILCITTERLYIITKKDPYPKEAVLFHDILGISMTPRKDGFVCIHTRETREDRGDWIFLLDHPCEFIVQLFMTMGRINNDDHLFKIRTKFQHTRRNLATISDECIVESRPSDTFRIAYENYEVLAIYSP